MTTKVSTIEGARDRSDARPATLPALMVIACGLVVVFCVGFLNTPAVHNAAHDTRHADGFPCH